MEKECWKCGSTKDLENWGNFTLCKKCADHNRKRWSKPPKRGGMTIKPSTDSDATYNPSNGNTELGVFTEDLPSLCVWIQHETTHLILHRLMGIKCCFQYDNMSKHSEVEWWTRGIIV